MTKIYVYSIFCYSIALFLQQVRIKMSDFSIKENKDERFFSIGFLFCFGICPIVNFIFAICMMYILLFTSDEEFERECIYI